MNAQNFIDALQYS